MSAWSWLWLGGCVAVWCHFLSVDGLADRRAARRLARHYSQWVYVGFLVGIVLSTLLWPLSLVLWPFHSAFVQYKRRKLGLSLVRVQCLHCDEFDDAEVMSDWMELPRGWLVSRSGHLTCSQVCAAREPLFEIVTQVQH